MTDIDVLVVGAGVVGLAIARRLSSAGLETIIVDGEDRFGSWTSSRNSEVIHAGIYYPQGSQKANLCTRGKNLLYDYCDRYHVPYRRLGKLIFAASAEQSSKLDAVQAAALAAGVTDLTRLNRQEARLLEPQLDCHEAVLSPSTGIIDSHAYMTTLLAEAEEHGSIFARGTSITRLTRTPDGRWSAFIAGEEKPVLTARMVVNSAGLTAHLLARETEGFAPALIPDVRYARGVYFTYSGRVPFKHLIYPTPVPGGLGTHLTLDMAGGARFGPDVEWINDIDYTVDPARKETFVAAARLIWPDLEAERLVPGYAGIRPKLHGPKDPAGDFSIMGPEIHNLPGLVALFGIESPGLTSSLAIADEVALRLGLKP